MPEKNKFMKFSDEDLGRANLIFEAVEQPLRKVVQFDCLINAEKSEDVEPDKDKDACLPASSSVKVGRYNTVHVEFGETLPYSDVIRALGKMLERVKSSAVKASNFHESKELEVMDKTGWDDSFEYFQEENSFDLRRMLLSKDDLSTKKHFRKILKEVEADVEARDEGKRPSKEVLEEIFDAIRFRIDKDKLYVSLLKAQLES